MRRIECALPGIPKILGSNPAFSTTHATCLLHSVNGAKRFCACAGAPHSVWGPHSPDSWRYVGVLVCAGRIPPARPPAQRPTPRRPTNDQRPVTQIASGEGLVASLWSSGMLRMAESGARSPLPTASNGQNPHGSGL